MENKDQSAYPLLYDGEKAESFCHNGLTKREYFAGLAMQGILASEPEFNCQPSELAKRSIECADELLTQLNK